MGGVPVCSKCGRASRKHRNAHSLEAPECRLCRMAGRNRVVPKPATSIDQTALVARNPSKPTAWEQRRQEGTRPLKAKGATATTSEQEIFNSVAPFASTPKGLTAGIVQQQVIQAYLNLQPPIDTNAPHLNWLVETDGLPPMSRVLESSTLAFCAAKVGRGADEVSLVQASRQWYGTGLRELRRALWDPKQMYKDDTLGACVLLALYEIAECPAQSRKGYKSHHDGCAILIKARGPESHSTGLGRAVFSTFRLMGVGEGMINKQTFLADPEWMEIPFLQRPKTILDKLVDLMLEIPALLASVDEVTRCESLESQFYGGIELLKTSVDLASRFFEFYKEHEETPGMLYWTNPKQKDSNLREGNFPEQYEFASINAALILLHYWASRTVILAIICKVHRNLVQYKSVILSGLDKRDTATGRLPHWTEIFDMSVTDSLKGLKYTVRNVCQSVEFCLHQSAKWAGGSAVMAPLRIVLDTVGRWPEFQQETKWILGALERVQQLGMAIIPYLGQIPTGYR